MGHFRKAWVAAAAAFGTSLGAALWQAADGGITGGEASAAIGAAVAIGVATGLGALGVKNDDTINLRQLHPLTRAEVEHVVRVDGQKPA